VEAHRAGLVERIAASPYLTCFPASLESEIVTLPDVHRFRDPALDVEPGHLPDWWHGDERPLVYASFGSVVGVNEFAAGLYRAVGDAVRELPIRVLLTVGKRFDISSLGAVPPNVHVEPWVPQGDVFPHARAVVCHGGSGTMLGALGAGLPQVIVPFFADQPENARRVAETGAGVVVSPAEETWTPTPTLDPAPLQAAIEAVLADGRYQRAARGIARELRALPSIDDSVELLVRTARG
jgi:MGT family glycosyltransferase